MKSFAEYTEPLYTPLIFRKWAAISIVSGALERKAWVFTRGHNFYPNLYVLLVGKPGAGKSLTIKDVEAFWRKLDGYHIAPISLTKASFMDTLEDAKRKIVRPSEDPPFVEYNSLIAAVQEFSDFAPLYEPSFMSILQSVYDCGEASERRRGKALEIKIPHSQFGFIAGTTPSFLNGFMPEAAWDQGFISRTIMVYSEESTNVDLFGATDRQDVLFKELLHDLKIIASLYGKMEWTQEAADAIRGWIGNGMEPIPDHRRLAHYNSRRTGHILKLTMVACAMRTNSLIITPEDVQTALDWLIEAEHYMPDIFKAMVSGGDSAAMEEAYLFVHQLFAKTGQAVQEHKILAFLRERVPVHAVQRTLDVMVSSRLLERVVQGAPGLSMYKPVARHLQRA